MKNPVLNEYEVLESAENILNKYDADSYKYIRESMISSVPSKMVSYIYATSARNDINAIDASIENINMVSVNHKDIADFFMNIHRGDSLYEDKPLAVSLRNINEIDDIRSQYIDLFVDDISVAVSDIMNGKIRSKDELERTQINPSYFTKIKKNCVKTTIPIENSYNDLLTYANTTSSYQVTEAFLTNVLLPFLRGYGETSKKLTIESTKLKVSINRGFSLMEGYMKTYNSMLEKSYADDKSKLISFYLYNAGRMYLELTNYVTHMMVRKINNYAQNVSEFMNLYNNIKAFYPEGSKILHESVLDGSFADLDEISNVSDILDGQCSVFILYARQIYNSHISDLDMIRSTQGVSIYDSDIDDNDYDKVWYGLIDSITSGISQSIETFNKNVKDPYLTIDEMKNKIYDGSSLMDRYSNLLCGISDISVYSKVVDDENSQFDNRTVFMTIMNELREFPNNIKTITDKISSIYKEILDSKDRIKYNVNNEYARFNYAEDMVYVLNDFEVQFRDVVLSLSRNITKRLDALDNLASSIISTTYDSAKVDISDTTDYVKESILSSIETDKLFTKGLIEKSEKMCFENSIKSSYGKDVSLVTEANVTVENNEQTVQANPSNADENKETLSNIQNETKTFMSEKLNGFGEKMETQKEKNISWIADHKEACLNRKLRNSKITIYNYDVQMQNHVVSDIQALTTNINRLNDDMTNGDKNEIINNLFGFIKISSDIPIRDKINQWFISGATPTKQETFQNSQIESKIPGMVSYCETYYNKLAGDIKSALDSLSAAWETKLGSFKNPNMEVVKEVDKQLKYFSGAVLNNSRDRAYAYMKVLNSILPAGGVEKENKEQQQNVQSTENQTNTQ